jgi:hypothetical protein
MTSESPCSAPLRPNAAPDVFVAGLHSLALVGVIVWGVVLVLVAVTTRGAPDDAGTLIHHLSRAW